MSFAHASLSIYLLKMLYNASLPEWLLTETFLPRKPSERGHVVYQKCCNEVIVRAWPRALSIPDTADPGFDKWALARLRLHKPFRTPDDLCLPSVKEVFSMHLARGGFPHLTGGLNDPLAENDVDDEPPFGSINDHDVEGHLCQDDYQQVMLSGRNAHDHASLLGSRELDLIHVWPDSWQGIAFDTLLTWLPATKACTEIAPPTLAPIQLASLSFMQHRAFDIINAHTFGPLQSEQLLMLVIGTAGTGKSYLINWATPHLRNAWMERR
jgi:hypothetical protein